MALIVQKFGGTSVGSLARIEAVAEQVIACRHQGHQVVVVLSAMAGETNRLLALAKGIDDRPNPRELDMLLASGEQVSISLLAMALIKRGHSAISMLADQLGIHTDNRHGKARITAIDSQVIREQLDQGRIVIAAGFQGRSSENQITTLGRGGSDTTAVALAAALKADECQIFTDVAGVYTADPRIVPTARLLPVISFAEMLELASLGARVLQNRAVELAANFQVRLRVLSSFQPDGGGTLICDEEQQMEEQHVAGVASMKDRALVTLSRLQQSHQQLPAILSCLQQANIELDMLVQNPEPPTYSAFSFTVARTDLPLTEALLAERLDAEQIYTESGLAKVSVVGRGLHSHLAISGVLFATLAAENIRPRLISTSEINISVLVEEKYLELAMRSLHDAYGLGGKG